MKNLSWLSKSDIKILENTFLAYGNARYMEGLSDGEKDKKYSSKYGKLCSKLINSFGGILGRLSVKF
jgi:hypothetical protein